MAPDVSNKKECIQYRGPYHEICIRMDTWRALFQALLLVKKP